MSDMELIELVLDFTRQLNELERKYYPLTQKSDRDMPAVFADYKAEVEKVYHHYLTQRERNYYTCISSPPRFSAMNDITLSTAERTKNRGIVTFYTRKGLVDFQFILLYKNEQWRINNFKQRYHSDDREVTYQWKRGSF